MRHEQLQNQHIGVSIIGAGERGVYFIGSRMAEIAAETGFRIVGVFDALPQRAEYAARHLSDIYSRVGLAHDVRVFDDLPAATEDPAVDLVLVTTHTNAHREPLEAALGVAQQKSLRMTNKSLCFSGQNGREIGV